MATKERDPLALKIAAAIKAARGRRGMSQRELGDKIGKTTGAVGNWESAQHVPAAENLFRVADVLEIDGRALTRGRLIFLEDAEAHDIPAEYSEKVDESVTRLWELVGHLFSTSQEARFGAIAAIEEYLEATHPAICLAIKTKHRS